MRGLLTTQERPYAPRWRVLGIGRLGINLADNRQQAAKEDSRGYLVIFDCRRKGLNETDTTLAKADGFHYEKREISFTPTYHKDREDFEEPIRMFLEPVCI